MPQTEKSFLQAKNLRKRYGERDVVRDVSISITQGEIVGLLGPNGAGKTTTFYMVIGITKPNAGEVFLNGTNMAAWPLYERARHGLSYLPQESSVFRKLTVAENLQIILEHTDLTQEEQQKKNGESSR